METLIIPTVLHTAGGIGLFLLFRAHPLWRIRRPARLAALSLTFLSLTFYSAFAIDGSASPALTALFVMITLLGHLPLVAHLLTAELPPLDADPEGSLAWTWRLRRRFLFGNERRRRRLWARKRRALRNRSTDPLLRLELLELCLGLGEYGEALFHAHALDEMLPRGPLHALALYRLGQVQAERQQRLADAQPALHRLLRLYPESEHRADAEHFISLHELK